MMKNTNLMTLGKGETVVKNRFGNIIKKIFGIDDRASVVGQALSEYMESDYYGRDEKMLKLVSVLKEGAPKNLSQVYENGPKKMFESVHGKNIAEKVGKVVSRLGNYVYSPSIYRRSFRSSHIDVYFEKFVFILETLSFSWEKFNMAEDLRIPHSSLLDNFDPAKILAGVLSDDDNGKIVLDARVYPDFLALEIDEGNSAVIRAVEEVCLGENNTKLLSDAIINGILKSSDKKLHRLLGDMLLAAKLQEGLRQSILENADNGCVDAFVFMVGLVLENDFLRYSSAMRACAVWMGLGYEFSDRRIVGKVLRLGYDYLNDEKKRLSGLDSSDVLEIYASLWASAVFDVRNVLPLIVKLMETEKYRKLVALYFLTQLEDLSLSSEIAAKYFDETDPDILTYVVENYSLVSPRAQKKADYQKNCLANTVLQNLQARSGHFEKLLKIASLIPPSGHRANGKPFEWCFSSVSREQVFDRLMIIAGCDFDSEKIGTLIDFIEYSSSDSRITLLKIFIDPANSAQARAFLFRSLNDKSMPVRVTALEIIKTLTLTEEEGKQVMNLLSLKTGDIRQGAVSILLGLPKEQSVEVAKILLADKHENKRLAALDMLTQLVKRKLLSPDGAAQMFSLMPKVTDKEKILMDAIAVSRPDYNRENGFGLYDPGYTPSFPELKPDGSHNLKSLFTFSPDRLKKLFDSLCDKIRQNKDYTYTVKYWDGSQQEVILGTLVWPRIPSDEPKKSGEEYGLDDFVLADVWRGWLRENKVSFQDILLMTFYDDMSGYRKEYIPNYLPWFNKIIIDNFNVGQAGKFIKYTENKDYAELALHLLDYFWREFPEKEKFAVLSGALLDFIVRVPAGEFKKTIEEENTLKYGFYYPANHQANRLAYAREINFLTKNLARVSGDDESFAVRLAVCYKIGKLSGINNFDLSETDIARGAGMGLLQTDALYMVVFSESGQSYISGYTGKSRYGAYKESAEKYPLIQEIINASVKRIIEIELKRGDTPTEVSGLAGAIGYHEGAGVFVEILVALGKETFVRGYIYGSSHTKKEVMSSLLKSCHPSADDNKDTLREALSGRISDKRLLEAAMYSPSWLPIVSGYLGWEGLESAAWYFHAHINQTFSAEKETEVARYSPVKPEEFNDGAFDIEWFKEAYSTLGPERFETLYDCAKYLTEGANHRRAQLFADATLGKLSLKGILAEIKEKRNKDKLLGFSLIPLGEDKFADALERYEYIQQFLKESKTFGAARRESEGKACEIALENLARNAGFSDSLRFTWSMETFKIKQITDYFTPKKIDGVELYVAIDDSGTASLICEKGGKKLSSVPARLRKDPYVLELKEVVSSLKSQYRRARQNLERSMEKRDVFSFSELKQLMRHPVIAPLLAKLLFAADDRIGAFCELLDLQDDAVVSIAHPYDLYKSGTWISCQRYAFEHELIQPFKQIFRELYLINEDEIAEKTVSRRYAGHQIQPKKTVALLKGRGWTVDNEDGLQRVFYKENIIAAMYAAADWFSPADTEAPAIEAVRFFDRKTREPLILEKIPPVIFSEIMRDIDLVVSVAHVGGVDPEASHSTIEMRASIVAELLNLLHVTNVTVKNRHATIKGTLGDYTVHLGSAVAHKMGSGAVNILAVPGQHRGRIFLPFADEDPRTAEIMSKILLLAEDGKIKDPAILAQIG